MMQDNSIALLPKWDHKLFDADCVEAFLRQLSKPCYIFLPGRNPQTTRAISTLLHGNEPSGVRALFHCLHQQIVPEVNLLCIVASIDAALKAPVFKHRMLLGKPDLNRCFNSSERGEIQMLAAQILNTLKHFNPECLIDIHNTSGAGPAFAVTTCLNKQHKSLTSLFASEIIYTNIQLGSLMECADQFCPTITIECGGAVDPRADAIAIAGLKRYMDSVSVLDYPSDDLRVYRHPVRVELTRGSRVQFVDRESDFADVNLPLSVESFNERVIQTGESIGWVGSKGIKGLCAIDGTGVNIIEKLFVVYGCQLAAARPLKIFMATANAVIAETDCLFYVADIDHD